jgi:Alginate lyase
MRGIAAVAFTTMLVAATQPGTGRTSPFPQVTIKGPDETALWRIEPPVLAARNTDDLNPVQQWSDSITRQVPVVLGGTTRTRAAYDRIMDSLYEWAGAEALETMTGERTRTLMPRRVIGAVTAYLAVKPIADAAGDIRRQTIERWIHQRAREGMTIFAGTPNGGARGLNYNNNLQATAATLAMEAFVITGDPDLHAFALAATREVLDEVDAEGFTSEIRRENPEAAEYFAHETLIYVVATAGMAEANGDASLWTYRGAKAGASRDPAILRAGVLLGEELGGNFVTKRHAAKTGRPQTPYRRPYVVSPGANGLMIPEGWQTCWIGPFLERYRDRAGTLPAMDRLRATLDYYRLNRISQYNGNVPLLPAMIYPSPLVRGSPARFGIAAR